MAITLGLDVAVTTTMVQTQVFSTITTTTAIVTALTVPGPF